MASQLTVESSNSISTKEDQTDGVLVPPRTYLYARDGANARIWILTEEETRRRSRKTLDELGNSLGTTASVIAGSTPNPFKSKARDHSDFQPIDGGSDHGPRLESGDRGPADFYIQYSKEDAKSMYILWEGTRPKSEAFPESKKLIEVHPESFFGNTSIYKDVEDEDVREARMDKSENSWFSMNRTMSDFDNVQYEWKTDVMGNFKCVRFDGTEFAYFHRTKFAWIEIGLVDIKEPTSVKLLHLLLAATLIKYQQDRKRRGSEGHGGP